MKHPNVYGVDMPSREEFVAHNRDEEGVCELLGADGCVQVNLAELAPEQLAQAVLDALGQPRLLEEVAAAARERALGYDEAACGQKLLLALQGTAAA